MRVGTFLNIDEKEKTAMFLGFGELIGDEIPDENAKGLCPMLRKLGMKNPKIQLDNGKIVWGGECWWSEESETKEQLKDLKQNKFKIIDVDIDDVRLQQS